MQDPSVDKQHTSTRTRHSYTSLVGSLGRLKADLERHVYESNGRHSVNRRFLESLGLSRRERMVGACINTILTRCAIYKRVYVVDTLVRLWILANDELCSCEDDTRLSHATEVVPLWLYDTRLSPGRQGRSESG